MVFQDSRNIDCFHSATQRLRRQWQREAPPLMCPQLCKAIWQHAPFWPSWHYWRHSNVQDGSIIFSMKIILILRQGDYERSKYTKKELHGSAKQHHIFMMKNASHNAWLRCRKYMWFLSGCIHFVGNLCHSRARIKEVMKKDTYRW